MVKKVSLLAGIFIPVFSLVSSAPLIGRGPYNHSAMLSVGGGLCRKMLGLFLVDALEGTGDNQLYSLAYSFSAAYKFSGLDYTFNFRHRFELSYNDNPDKKFRYASLGWVPELVFWVKPWFFAMGVGPSFKTRVTPTTGGYYMVHAPFSVGLSLPPVSVELVLRHTSNMYLASPNEGADYLGFSLSYTF